MKRILSAAIALLLAALSSNSQAVVTEFEDIALTGSTSTRFIRFEAPGVSDRFFVAFSDRLTLWDGSNYSFVLRETAPTNAMVIDGDGTSIRTALEIDDSTNQPINITHSSTDQNFGIASLDSSGLYNGGIGFFTDSASYPFYVFDQAGSQSLSVGGLGVGVGTYDAIAPIHVYADGFPYAEAQILVENNAFLPVGPRTLLNLKNPGNTKFSLENTDAGVAWAFTNSGIDFRVSRQGSGVVEFRVDNDGNMELAGVSYAAQHINTSSRRFKNALGPVDSGSILEKLTQLPISTWVYKATPDMPHIGPMAEDFLEVFGLGDGSSISTVDTAGIAFAAIQELHEQQAEKDEAIAALRAEKDSEFAALRADNESLRKELESIKGLLATLSDTR